MKQSVDLFPAHLRHEPVILGALHALYATGILLVILTAISLLVDSRAGSVLRNVQALRADVEHQRSALSDFERTHPVIAVDEELAAKTAALEQERTAKTKLLALIASNELGNRRGFSSYLDALARHPVSGIWFEKIESAVGGRALSLGGGAVEGGRVPRLLQALGKSESFQGRSFYTLRMERSEDGIGHVQFELSAKPDRDAEDRR